MIRNYDTRHIFMAIGAGLLVLSPIFLLTAPSVIVNTLYYKRGIWITYVPGENYVAFAAGLLLLVLACVLLWLLDVKKWTISASIICVILSGILLYMASLSYVTLSNEEISFRTLFSKEKQFYAWEELDQLLFYERPPEEKEISYYEFHFKDGQMLTMKQNNYVRELQGSLSSKVRGLSIPFVYVED